MKVDVSAPDATRSVSLSAHHNGDPKERGIRRAVTVHDEEDEDMSTDFAPGGDADYFVEEDDEGRFFGGGLTMEQKDILNIFDNAGNEGVQEDVSLLCWTRQGLIMRLNPAVY
jgi:beta-catenin-like protein 1